MGRPFPSPCLDAVKLRPGFEMCVCYVNHQGESPPHPTARTKLSLLSARGVRPVEQHPLEAQPALCPKERPKSPSRPPPLVLDHPQIRPSIRTYGHPSPKPVSGCLLRVCVIVAWQARSRSFSGRRQG